MSALCHKRTSTQLRVTACVVKRFPQTSKSSKPREVPRAPSAAALRLINHAEEFLPRQRIVTEAAQHSAGDEVCVRLMHAARGHAVMRRLKNDANPPEV
jgi:hypothetical protein